MSRLGLRLEVCAKHLAETGGKFTTEVCNILALTARHLLLEVADLVDCSQQRATIRVDSSHSPSRPPLHSQKFPTMLLPCG